MFRRIGVRACVFLFLSFYRCMHPLLGMMFFYAREEEKKLLTATMERKERHELLGKERS